MSDRKAAFIRQRRSLNILSIGLIIYQVAGGEFDELQIYAIGITLNDEGVAIAFIWIALVYFLFRYLRFGEDARYEWYLDRLFEINHESKFVDLLIFPDGTSSSERPGILRNIFKRHFIWNVLFQNRNERGIFVESKGSGKPQRVGYWILFFTEFKSDLRAAFMHTGFSEYVLPLLLALTACSIGVYRVIY